MSSELDALLKRQRQARHRLKLEQALEVARFKLEQQRRAEHAAWIGTFRVSAALHHGIDVADVTPDQITEAQIRAARYAMPKEARA